MARKSKATILSELHKTALAQFDAIQTREKSDRALGIEDLKFANDSDGQWDESAIEKRRDQPRLTINRVAPAISQAVGDQRQNRTQIKVRPASGDADKAVAKIYDGIIRNIEAQSQAENAYDNAFDEAVTCGYGGWRVVTEFNDDDSFEQDIKIKPSKSAVSSLYFGLSDSYDKRDAPYAFYTTFISTEDFKKRYPDATETDFAQTIYSSNRTWFRDKEIRIAEYWVKTPISKRIGLMSDGRVLDLDEEKDVLDELAFEGVTVEKKRTVKSYKVEMYVMNGAEILKPASQWAGKYIPLIPDYGKIATIDGRDTIRGIVRFAKDANRAYNYAVSANIEAVALSPKDPYWLTYKNVGENKSQFENFTVKNSPFMFYEPDAANGNAPPQRTGAPSVQQGLISIMQQAAMDVETATELHSPSLGNAPQLLSEKSIRAQAEKGDRGLFIYSDNLQKSIQYTGDILVDLIPRIYDTERLVRVLGVDGASEVIKINERAFDEFNDEVIDEQSQKPVIVNDLRRGKYDVETVTGASFITKRRESLQQLIELMEASPEFAAISPDLIAKNLDVLEGEEITKRMRKRMIQQGVAEPTKEEIEEMGLDKPSEPDPQSLALIENLNSQTSQNFVKNQEALSDINKKAIEALNSLNDNLKEQVDAGVPVTAQQLLAVEYQTQIVMLTQDKLAQATQASIAQQ